MQVQEVAYIYVLMAEWIWVPMIPYPTWWIIIDLNINKQYMYVKQQSIWTCYGISSLNTHLQK